MTFNLGHFLGYLLSENSTLAGKGLNTTCTSVQGRRMPGTEAGRQADAIV